MGWNCNPSKRFALLKIEIMPSLPDPCAILTTQKELVYE